MTTVEIEYCVPCGHLDRAQDLQEELLTTFGRDLESVALVTEDGGTFRVHVDDELVFDVDEEGYDADAIVDRVRDRL
ncbi:SelT/SelW/SelH family protein [Saliphagus infecundisoli]|uniref:SelT/SelW/SelH family protein n=1 Tax=Saliphagus infecundisoli TaxID=1849069 RepID=A0ABD5QEU9_9EURY|nr:Rdx family protein [Saliphagus infecundisoli]